MTRGDIHNRKGTYERLKTQIEKSPDITNRDKEILIEGSSNFPSFSSYMENEGISQSRINRYLRTWKRLLERVDWQIEEVDKTKLTNYVGKLNTDEITRADGEPLSESTKREIKKGIRKLYTDYAEKHKKQLNLPEDFDSEEMITFTLTIDKNYTPSDKLPTPKTVRKLVKHASKTRDKAYIMTLWSTGGRNSEVLGLQWKDIQFTNSIGKVAFKDTKTGGDHQVPMGEAYPFLYQHKLNDPRSDEPDAFIFRSTQSDGQLTSNGASEIIKRVRRKEEIEIPERIKTNPHAFRKGRTSYWARQEKNETWICKYMNWAPGSKTVRHYCRVAQEDIDEGVAESLGLEHDEENSKEDESKILTPSECHACGTINGFDTEECMDCGETLETSDLYRESKVKEMKEEIKSEMIEKQVGKSREEVRGIAEEVVEKEVMQ